MQEDSAQQQQNEDKKKRVTRDNFQEFLGIFRYVLPYKVVFAIGIIFLVLSTFTSLAFPYIASMMADAAVGNGTWSIREIGILMVIILILQGIFSYARIVLFSIVSENTMADIRQELYKKLISLNIAFFEKNRVGELTGRIAADVTQLQSALSINLAEFFRQIFTLIAGVSIIAYLSLKLTLVMLSTFPLTVVAAIFFGKFIRSLAKKSQDALAKSNIIADETLQSVQVVKAFTNEAFEVDRYRKAIQKVVDFALREARFRGGFITFIISAVFGGIVIVLWFGASLVAGGEMTIGELLGFMFYTFFIGGAIGGMGNLYGNLLKAVGATERVRTILDEPSELTIKTVENAPRLSGDIVYQNVHFSYPTRTDLPVLKNVSLHIQEGQKVALVGPSGAGKSTIIQLLMRFYEVKGGDIFINGQGIKSYDLSHLRSNIGIVPQEVLLFGGSIRENIAYGRPHATDAEIAEAARQANALEFIQTFPEGLDTLVGERGIKLSGGQRQRIAIARAILKDPSILILDEATSSLDAESEKLVQEALDVLMENRTTIIIAHRLATIRKVDRIYVIDKGIISEQGSHAELANMENGLYQSLLKLQFELN